ncbi:polysaccharide deacetylase family protein [Fictibacillus terranigra]|uniref:Polysaccharide deacetylase family protein n=1 Tax=Fictibacillus terranigra TaxID=3058424 RepID=A0ABT8E4L9_9BACL|nr:polysaccharide deacetylase family protein [Fictibacillus sp. CENA-BCM004]MDN4072863.1 polysaccharide deacetylase family protein [Fictibacillus sp. CENA-BCM004]
MKKIGSLLAICLVSQLTVSHLASAASYTVQPGDTVKKISNKYHTSQDRIVNLNKLFSTGLADGQRLEIPNPNKHSVKAGDTISKLSSKYGVSTSKMKRANPQIKDYHPGQKLNVGQNLNVPMKQTTGYYMGNTSKKQIALTFDDGPDNRYTPQILKILKEKGVKATFFVIGEQAKQHPEVLKQIHREGHVIGNHTWDHQNVPQLTDQELENDVQATSEEIEKVTGAKTHLFRPPMGEINDHQVSMLNKQGYRSIIWTADTKDWEGRPSEQIVSAVNKDAAPGVIALQHSYHASGKFETVKALPEIIDQLRAKGYKFVTVPTLIDDIDENEATLYTPGNGEDETGWRATVQKIRDIINDFKETINRLVKKE